MEDQALVAAVGAVGTAQVGEGSLVVVEDLAVFDLAEPEDLVGQAFVLVAVVIQVDSFDLVEEGALVVQAFDLVVVEVQVG